jgi:pyridoxamine 5'-phosphate oxidase
MERLMTPLEEAPLPPGPLPLFETWHAAAAAHEGIQYAGAACLSTVSADGFPEGRIVLLHAVGSDGFAFFTDVRSAKGRALARTPRAALTFYWGPLERQVRVQGRVALAAKAEADRFFAERPRRSRLTAWASAQSRSLAGGREPLAQRMEALQERFAQHETIPRPSYWRAYRVQPRRVEFWEARAKRLHARVRYERDDAGESGKPQWTIRRLAP